MGCGMQWSRQGVIGSQRAHWHRAVPTWFAPPSCKIIGLCRRHYVGNRLVANYHFGDCRPASTQLIQGLGPPNSADLLQDRGANRVDLDTRDGRMYIYTGGK
jgi:hypothetical protein